MSALSPKSFRRCVCQQTLITTRERHANKNSRRLFHTWPISYRHLVPFSAIPLRLMHLVSELSCSADHVTPSVNAVIQNLRSLCILVLLARVCLGTPERLLLVFRKMLLCALGCHGPADCIKRKMHRYQHLVVQWSRLGSRQRLPMVSTP